MNATRKTSMISLLLLLALGTGGLVFAQNPLDPGKTNVTYSGPNGVTLRGYLAMPKGSGPFPGVVMIHEWWGLNRDTTVLDDALKGSF